jgi:RNA polymerase sigma-70 factor (ECF subfamily)
MHNLFVSRIRKQSVRGRMQTVEEVREETLGVDGGQERHMQLRDVVRALDALPEEQRSVLVLVSVEDLSYAEVATVLGIPTGTVMSRLVRGRERLRQMVEGAPGALRRRVG